MKSSNKIGNINITSEAIASLTGEIVSECYGVVGMASKHLLRDGIAVLLRKENYSKGVIVRQSKEGVELDLYLVICHGVRINEVAVEVQKKVKYELEKMFDINFSAINIYVQGIKVID